MEIIKNNWRASTLEAFKQFIQTTEFVKTSQCLIDRKQTDAISNDSAHIYILMFSKFIRWMELQKKTLFSLTPIDLLGFLELEDKNKRHLNSKIAYRYLRLIERCYIHLQVHPNPAQHAIFNDIRKRTNDQEMVALNSTQFQKFIDALPAHKIKHPNPSLAGWKRRRDRAMQLLMLCAGLRVSEVINLQIDAIEQDALTANGSIKLRITSHSKQNTHYEHTTFLNAAGVPDVMSWWDERQKMGIPGRLLFPANLEGQLLDKATIYRQVKATFKRAGIEPIRSGGRTLRNTFAVQALKNGSTSEDLTAQLGLVLEESLETYAIASTKIE